MRLALIVTVLQLYVVFAQVRNPWTGGLGGPRKTIGSTLDLVKSVQSHPKYHSLQQEKKDEVSAVSAKFQAQRKATKAQPQQSSPTWDNYMAPSVHHYHTVIVGAGVGGLMTARSLVHSGVPPCSILVVEGRDRVGGRIINLPIRSKAYLGSFVVEGGGTWIGPTQDAIIGLNEELGLETFETFYSPEFPPEAVWSDEARPFVAEIDRLAQSVPLENPWDAPGAREWDSITFADWIGDQVQDTNVQEELFVSTTGTIGATADEVSMLFFLWWVRSTTSFSLTSGLRDAAQDKRYVKGSAAVPEKLYQSLAEAGVHFSFDTRVRSVHQSPNGLLTIPLTNHKKMLIAKHLVVALGSGDRQFIEFTPPLSDSHEGWARSWPSGTSVKGFLVYDSPWWREAPWNSPVPFNVPNGVGAVFDYSPQSDRGPGVLMAFLPGDAGAGPDGRAARETLFRAALTLHFGNSVPIAGEYIEQYWGPEVGTWNCIGFTPPGVLTEFGPEGWRQPAGHAHNIHFAGSDTSAVWFGYIDGAVRAGNRAAGEILEANDHWKVPCEFRGGGGKHGGGMGGGLHKVFGEDGFNPWDRSDWASLKNIMDVQAQRMHHVFSAPFFTGGRGAGRARAHH
eukprot:TRINITY_DN57484_c0_g1_i1.p1 TRINITY_DN57484_c0_g1~~TRINITY_DN57484_c0_g1_i1.p1  ORF type:complete len:620 (+),score=72.51 TRINITY_DN57484_c0_g1_i1:78-1937(+)